MNFDSVRVGNRNIGDGKLKATNENCERRIRNEVV